MPLNDPFGRVSRKRRQTYEALRMRLQQAGIASPEALHGVRRNMTRTAAKLLLLILGAALLVVALFPGTAGPWLVLAGLLALWLSVNYLQTRAMLRRYLHDECGDPRD